MNELAHVIHDLVAGDARLDSNRLSRLSPQERAAMVDLQPLLKLSPPQLAALLAQDGPTTVWFGPLPVADRRAST